jgi:hypothetical protein
MHEIRNVDLPSTGVVACKLSNEEIEPLWHEARDIQRDFAQAQPYNNNLMGNIRHEYKLESCINHIEKLAIDLSQHYRYFVNEPDRGLYLAGAWINFQRKYEFNPPHNHDGVMVVVIYLQVPYTREQELAASGVPRDKNMAGTFVFQYVAPDGRIASQSLEIDRSWENVMIMFPAWMLHSVYPFYTSDDFRISVSGNLHLR